MPTRKLVTVRVTTETLALIQHLMRVNGEKQHGLLQRLVETEMKRLERVQTQRADWNRL